MSPKKKSALVEKQGAAAAAEAAEAKPAAETEPKGPTGKTATEDADMKDVAEAGAAEAAGVLKAGEAAEAGEAGQAAEAGQTAESGQAAAAEAEVPKEPEKPKELEEDALLDARPRVKAGTVGLSLADATLNVMPVAGGSLLMTLTEGGLQYLLAGVRATVGLKSGRYFFEAKIVESLNPAEPQGSHGRTPQPRQLVRIGVSLAGSSLFLTDGPDSVCFDSEGYYVHEKNRKRVSQKFSRDQTVALVINLEKNSPNAHTISLFRNGVRISEPQELPENMKGKALYPTITYKNVTLQVNFGPVPKVPLPFVARMLADAAKADVEVCKAPAASKPEVVFPVGLPDEGFFDWVDDFVEKNPSYTELSDRKILEWAMKSGLWRPKSSTGSNDKPDMKFGIPFMDDLSVRRVLEAVAPTSRRNFIVPELRSNLLAADRKASLLRFGAADFKRTAAVLVGEPTADFKGAVQAKVLADKQAKADAERKRKAQEDERKRLLEEKKKKAEEAKKMREASLKKQDGQHEEKEEAEAVEEKVPEATDETKADEAMAAVELTDEEKKVWYRKLDTPDLSERTLASSYASFTLPAGDEGFDEVKYFWQDESTANTKLKAWVLEKKLTQRVEDLQPGDWFKEEWCKWTRVLADWRRKQADFKDPSKRKALMAKKKEEAAKKKVDGEEVDEKPMEINAEDIEVSTVEDVSDLGNGEPLFANFVYEDWALLVARFELSLLLHAFKKDLNDPDRPSFGESHLAYYYNKYFKKTFNVKYYGVENVADFVELIKDTIRLAEKGFMEAVVAEDTEPSTFVKWTEEHRRERQRRIDAGDETAKLKFSRPAPVPPKQPQAAPPGRAPAAGARPAASGATRSPYYAAPAPAPASSFAGQKRPHSASSGSGSVSAYSSAYAPPKHPRTSGYGGYSGGSGSGGSGSGYYRR